jgi:prepilin-type processing-associated H-X9-DG protein
MVVLLMVCPSDPLPEPVNHYQYPPPGGWFNGYWAIGSYGGNGGTLAGNFSDPTPMDGVFYIRSRVQVLGITDGTSNTFLFGERSHHDPEFDKATLQFDPAFWPLASYGPWASAYNIDGSMFDVMLGTPCPINYKVPPGSDDTDWTWELNRLNAYGSGHPGGANFAFADGSVRFIRDSIPLKQLQALSTRAGGEVVELP